MERIHHYSENDISMGGMIYYFKKLCVLNDVSLYYKLKLSGAHEYISTDIIMKAPRGADGGTEAIPPRAYKRREGMQQ